MSLLRKSKKEKEIKQQLSELDIIKNRQDFEDKHKKKKELSEQAYQEWLIKKEKQRASIENFNSSFVVTTPFYPSSKITSFSR